MKTPQTTWNRELFVDFSADSIKSHHSQYGEDGVIDSIFRYCPPQDEWCVEAGAADGLTISNTAFLIERGWCAVLIEAIKATHKDGLLFSGYDKIVDRYKNNLNVFPVHKTVEKDNLDYILASYLPSLDFDFLSLDIDSYDAEVWKNLVRFRPRVVCIECNEAIDDLEQIYYNMGDPHNAASVGFLKQIGEAKGYDFVCATRCNAIFVDRDFGLNMRI